MEIRGPVWLPDRRGDSGTATGDCSSEMVIFSFCRRLGIGRFFAAQLRQIFFSLMETINETHRQSRSKLFGLPIEQVNACDHVNSVSRAVNKMEVRSLLVPLR